MMYHRLNLYFFISNNAPQSCFMELFTDESGMSLTAQFPFLYSVTFSSQPLCLAATQWVPPCVCQGDGWYLQCWYLGVDSTEAPAEPPRENARLCAIGSDRQTAPFQEMSYFLPTQNALMEIMTHIRHVGWIARCTFILRIPDYRIPCFCLIAPLFFSKLKQRDYKSR